MKKLLIVLIMGLHVHPGSAQDDVDSLLNAFHDESLEDTMRLKAVHKVIWKAFLFQNPDTAMILADQQFALAKKTALPGFMAQARNNQASVFYVQSDYPTALEYMLKCLSLQREAGFIKSTGATLNNIGIIYKLQEEYDRAMEFFEESYAISKEYNDSSRMSIALTNITTVHNHQKNFHKALEVAYESLAIKKLLNDQKGIATIKLNMGEFHYSLGQKDSAYLYFVEAIEGKRAVNDKLGLSLALVAQGDVYYDRGDYAAAIQVGTEALQLAQELESFQLTYNAARLLMRTYRATGKYLQALEMYDMYIENRDSVESSDNSKKIQLQRLTYENQQRTLADSIQNAEAQKVKDAEIAKTEAEAESQRKQKYFFGAILLGVAALLVVTFVMLARIRKSRRIIVQQKKEVETEKEEADRQRNIAEMQRKEAEHQRHLVEEKNQEIIDSINYARRLQEAILPPTKLVKEYLPDSFILYKPKDIVAGDFYWMETLGDTVYFAAADCTGHGVPGAMVSVVCSNALTKVLLEEKITAPGKMLDRTRELVIDQFARSEEDVKDGMDVSLCALNIKTRELQWAGANNPLWLIRTGAEEIEEVKADKQPIGKYAGEKPFTSHSISLNEGDSLYIFSDGFPDQFGGDKGKKYKSGNLKKFFLDIVSKPHSEQRQLLLDEFENWRGDIEQIDDVCVIGVRV